ncbi:hypothetical protein P2H44_04030 [Albimonas sp. CAU 1670]|uniref:hypothetical protein n=1 Tax=Albimonas sp. CAU 1670 TaxID=3032599 RepID=UPI0023D9A1FA|nr:hypothetical protein [Albimonas sp. CAU 1670]MDF2231712.1 hypothetical protein [Albimonas sp. CAU 1670]
MSLELARDEREDRAVVIAIGGPDEAPPGPRVEIVRLQQATAHSRVNDVAPVTELGADASIVLALERVRDGADLGDDLLVAQHFDRRGVEARPRDAHPFASPPDGEAAGPLVTDGCALLGDVPERKAPSGESIASA